MGIVMLAYSDKTYMLPYFNRDIEVQLGYGVYSNNNSLAVIMMCRAADLDEDLLEDEDYPYDETLFDEILGTITINLESSSTLPPHEQYIDINNFPQLSLWLMENGLASPTGINAKNGRVLYPAYKFQVPPDYVEGLEKI